MTMLNDTVSTARSTMESAKEGTEHAASAAFSTLTGGVHAAASLVSLLRTLEAGGVLGRLGLTRRGPRAWLRFARRRSPLGTIALFGSGVLVGTGVGMLIAPASGADLRRNILARIKGMEEGAERAIDKAKAGAREMEEKLAVKVQDAAATVDRKAAEVVSRATAPASEPNGDGKGAEMGNRRPATQSARPH